MTGAASPLTQNGSSAEAAEVKLPRVVIGTRYVKAATVPEDLDIPEFPCFEIVPFREAFETQWSFDAHFVCYDIPGWEGSLPRLKKRSPFVQAVRAAGLDVVVWGLTFDYDNPEHAPWTHDLLDQHYAAIERACQRCPKLADFSVYYRTKGGARFVYVLDEPVSAGPESEALHRAVRRQWAQQGVFFDPACGDWTRLFRLPRVMRET